MVQLLYTVFLTLTTLSVSGQFYNNYCFDEKDSVQKFYVQGVHGQVTWKEVYYYKNGNVKGEIISDKKYGIDKKVTCYYENEKIKEVKFSREPWFYFLIHKYKFVRITWDENGKKRREVKWILQKQPPF